MIPNLYDRFDYVGTTTPPVWADLKIGRLRDALSCVETSSINSEWELVMEYPMNGLHASDIQVMRIIYTSQPFFIYRVLKNASAHTMTVYARHVNYLLSFVPSWPFNKTAVDPATFLNNAISNKTPIPFHFATSITDTVDVYMLSNSIGMSSMRDYMLNDSYGMTALYGGEWVFDGLNCTFQQRKGTTRDITIRYGVDLIDARQEERIDEIVTHIIPYAYITSTLYERGSNTDFVYEQGTEKYLNTGSTHYYAKRVYPSHTDEVSVTPHIILRTNKSSSDASAVVATNTWYTGSADVYALPGSENLPFKHIQAVDVLDATQGQPQTLAEVSAVWNTTSSGVSITDGIVSADGTTDTRRTTTTYNLYYHLAVSGIKVHYNRMRTMATNYVNSHPVEFPVDITVRSLPEFMNGVQLGDTITVKYPDYGISTEAEIMTMEYDALKDQIISYTLGKGRTSFAETMLHQDNKINRLDGLVTANNPLKGI